MQQDPVTMSWTSSSGTEDLAAIVAHATQALDASGAVIVPTDTVYGVAAHLQRPEGLERLFALKDRDRSNALAVLAADATQANELLDVSELAPDVAGTVATLMDQAWPGALTLVGPRASRWHHIDLGGRADTVGVRVPASAVVRAIAASVGPLVTTSANRSGEPTPSTARDAAASLVGEVALVIDTGPCTAEPSTVLDVKSRPFRILRQGGCDPLALGVSPSMIEAVGTGGRVRA